MTRPGSAGGAFRAGAGCGRLRNSFRRGFENLLAIGTLLDMSLQAREGGLADGLGPDQSEGRFRGAVRHGRDGLVSVLELISSADASVPFLGEPIGHALVGGMRGEVSHVQGVGRLARGPSIDRDMPEHLPGLGMDLFADGGLNLFRQVQQEQPPTCRFVVFLVASCSQARSEPSTSTHEGSSSDRTDQFLPTPLADRIDGAPVEASFGATRETCGSGRSETTASCPPARSRRAERRPPRGRHRGGIPGTSFESAGRIERRTLARRHGHASRQSVSEASGWFSWCRRNSSLNSRVFVSRRRRASRRMTEFWRKRVDGLRRTGRGQ